MHRFVARVFQECFKLFLKEENWLDNSLKFWDYTDIIQEFLEFRVITESFMNPISIKKKIESSTRRARIDYLCNCDHQEIIDGGISATARKVLADQNQNLDGLTSKEASNLKGKLGNRDLTKIESLMKRLSVDKTGFVIQKIGIRF